MTSYFVTSALEYYEGEKIHPQDVEVPQRPSVNHDWDGTQWVINAARKAAADALVAQAAQDAADIAAIKLDNQLTTFATMTPAQVDAWIVANVTNLATATNALKILAKLLLVVARRSLR